MNKIKINFWFETFNIIPIAELNIAFEKAANSVHITDEIEMFTFDLPKVDADSFSYETKGNANMITKIMSHLWFEFIGFINFITLNYKVKWPLHLLFSPAILDNYNNLFRFLLRIKKTQFDLHCVWSHHRENKLKK